MSFEGCFQRKVASCNCLVGMSSALVFVIVFLFEIRDRNENVTKFSAVSIEVGPFQSLLLRPPVANFFTL